MTSRNFFWDPSGLEEILEAIQARLADMWNVAELDRLVADENEVRALLMNGMVRSQIPQWFLAYLRGPARPYPREHTHWDPTP